MEEPDPKFRASLLTSCNSVLPLNIFSPFPKGKRCWRWLLHARQGQAPSTTALLQAEPDLSPFLAARRRVGAAGRCQRRKSTPSAKIGEAQISPPCCLKSLSCAAKSQTKNLPKGEGKRARRGAGEAVLNQPRAGSRLGLYVRSGHRHGLVSVKFGVV